LLESVLGGTDEALLERRVHFAIGSRVPPGFAGDPLLPARFVCAAAPGHPLHKLGRQLTLDDLRGHRHLVIRDSGVQRTRPGANWVSEARWTVSSKATSIRAAVMELGFSWYHADSIREELDAGALKPLPLREGAERVVQLYLVFADREATGPGALRLAEIIRERTRVECEPHTGAPAGGATAG
jgi:DNA-binding transcriptional LysR family regulator